jgi:multiple sugar transport system permease protein
MTARARVLRSIAAVLLGLVFLTPLVIMVLGSLRAPLQTPPQGLDLWPTPPRWANYDTVGSFLEWRRSLVNSALIVAVAVPVTVLIGSAAGFVLRAGSRGARIAVGLACAVGLLVPASALWVPRVAIFRAAGLADHQLSVVPAVVAATAPFAVLLYALAYSRLPRSWFEVAATEGVSALRTWWRLAHPSVRAASFAVALITFVYGWSDYIDPLTLIASPERWPLALSLRSLAESEAALYPIYLAAAVLATVPAVLLFLLAHRTLFAVTLGDRR